jgi:hypothetical protein
MDWIVEREDVWATSIEDKPGGLAKKLTVLADAGADLDFIIARRSTDRPGTGVLFVTPLRGDNEVQAATESGFSVASRMHSLRVEGPNQPGVAAKLSAKLAKAGINVRGLSAAVTGMRFVIHLAFDSDEDCQKAVRTLQTKPAS